MGGELLNNIVCLVLCYLTTVISVGENMSPTDYIRTEIFGPMISNSQNHLPISCLNVFNSLNENYVVRLRQMSNGQCVIVFRKLRNC